MSSLEAERCEVVYRIRIDNSGSDAARDIRVEDVLPDGVFAG